MELSRITHAVCYVLLILFVYALPAQSGTIFLPGAAGGAFTVNVSSIKEKRFRSTIRQQYDFSCGSAALATLLTYHYEKSVSEQEVFDAMYSAGNKEKIRTHGFSLLDMKNYLETNGYQAVGYQSNLDNLSRFGVPAIVLISLNGYKHFVVVTGVSETEVLFADPAVGSRTLPRKEFEAMWNGLLFLIRNHKNVAAKHFNRESDWQEKVKAPVETVLMNNQLTNMTLLLRQ